jgi:diacylglycerol kinase (ATP)
MPGIGIISNPFSKANKRDPNRPELLGYILGKQGQLAVTRSLDHLSEVAHNFKDSDVEILAINGGDGTVSQTLTAFSGAYGDRPLPKIVVLRGGTMNVLANNLGVRGSSERLLYQLVEGYSAGKTFQTVSIRALRVNGMLGFLFADGIAVNFLSAFYANKKGAFGAFVFTLKVTLSSLFGGKISRKILKDQDLTIQRDEDPPLTHKTSAVFASCLNKLPFGLPLFSNMPRQDGLFEYFHTTEPARNLPRQLLPIIRERRLGRTPYKQTQLCKTLKITYPGAASYSLDGEILTQDSSTVEIGTGIQVDFLIPSKILPSL